MELVNEGLAPRGTVGVALDDADLAEQVRSTLFRSGRYKVAMFGRAEIAGGAWPKLNLRAVVSSPQALQKFRERAGGLAPSPPVILALERSTVTTHLAKLACANAFVLIEESLPRLPSLVPLCRHDLTVMPHMLRPPALKLSPRVTGLKRLSARDLRILRELASGHSNQAIAERLDMPVATTKFLIRRVLDALGFRNRTEAAVFAVMMLAPGPNRSTTFESH